MASGEAPHSLRSRTEWRQITTEAPRVALAIPVQGDSTRNEFEGVQDEVMTETKPLVNGRSSRKQGL